jgi:hypothetical protein
MHRSLAKQDKHIQKRIYIDFDTTLCNVITK